MEKVSSGAKVLNSGLFKVNEFKLQSRYYVHFRSNALRMNLFTL